MHKKNSSVTMLGAAGMVGYAVPPKEELVSHYVMFCWYATDAMLCFLTHKKNLSVIGALGLGPSLPPEKMTRLS